MANHNLLWRLLMLNSLSKLPFQQTGYHALQSSISHSLIWVSWWTHHSMEEWRNWWDSQHQRFFTQLSLRHELLAKAITQPWRASSIWNITLNNKGDAYLLACGSPMKLTLKVRDCYGFARHVETSNSHHSTLQTGDVLQTYFPSFTIWRIDGKMSVHPL